MARSNLRVHTHFGPVNCNPLGFNTYGSRQSARSGMSASQHPGVFGSNGAPSGWWTGSPIGTSNPAMPAT
jgi:hypothetical protein